MSALENETVRTALGLVDAAVLVAVGALYLDPPLRWAVYAVAVVSAVVTPWALGKVVEE